MDSTTSVMPLDTLRTIADTLAARGLQATLEYPGYIEVQTSRYRIAAGDAGEGFSAEVWEGREGFDELITTHHSGVAGNEAAPYVDWLAAIVGGWNG